MSSYAQFVYDNALIPVTEWLGEKYTAKASDVLLLAIGFQESGFEYREQVGGPANGFWQFEAGGGVRGVLRHRWTKGIADDLCSFVKVNNDVSSVHRALVDNDVLAAGMARLLLYTDDNALPKNRIEGWKCYLRTWRPGKPHPEYWAKSWAKALAVAGVQ